MSRADHKHLMRVRRPGTVSLEGRFWTLMRCECGEERLVEHGWFQQLDRTWKKA